MSRAKPPVTHERRRVGARDASRYSEAGDTLVEVLLALIVLGLTSVALLIAFSTSISASATHRTLAVDDTVLATATQVTISNIQAQPTLFSCPPNLSNYPGYGSSGITLPSPYAGKYTVLYASTNPVQYWNTTTESFGTTCEPNEPQLITISLQGTSYTNSFVVDYPIGSSNALNAGSAAQLVFLQQPVGGYAGSPFTTQPIVEVLTAGGTPSTVTTDLSPVILTLTQGTGVLSGCTGNEILGVITFSGCTIGTGGSNFEITATDGSLTPAVSNPFSVSSSNYHLVFTSQPVAAASGYGFSTDPVVAVENSSNATDTSWAGTITLSLSGGALSALPTKTCAFTTATTITLTAINGTVTMPSGCAFSGGYYYDASRNPPQTATQYTMTATANPNAQTDAAVPVTSNTFAVTSFGLPTQIVFTVQPTGVASSTAATPFTGQPTVAVEDSFGNVVTSASNTINLSINSGGQGITLSNCNAPTPTNAGLYVFSGCEGSAYGTQLTLTASSSGLTSATSSAFNITNVATQLLFTTQPVAGDSGSVFAIEPVLTIEDASNRVVTSASTPIAFNPVVPSSGTITSCTSLVPQSGVVTVANCTFAGVVGTPYTVVATSGSLTSAPSSSFTPTGPGPASQLVFTTSPVAGVSGTAFTSQPIVKVEDSAGNIVTSSTAVISLTPSGGTLASCSGLTASAGVVTVSNCTFAGVVGTNYTLTATSGPLTSLPSTAFSPTYAGTPSQIVVAGCSSAIVSLTSCTTTATIEDVYANIETADNSSVLTFSQVSGGGSVTGLGSGTVVGGVASDLITGAAQGLVGVSASGYSLPANTISVTVNAPTTTTLSSSANPSVVGQTVSYTATVAVTSPDTGIPTGNIEFFDNGVAISTCGGASGVVVNGSGKAVCALSWPSIVGQSITAGYLGNASAYYLPSASTVLSQVVNQASTTTAVTSSANPSVVGQTVTYTATVSVTSPGSGSPTGNIEFFDNGTAISTCGGTGGVTVNGSDQATCLIAWPSTVGQTITAKYLGDANYVASPVSSPINQVVNKASPTLSVTAPGTGIEGTAITAANITATLANSSGASDTNTITFTVFGPQTTAPTTCTSGGTAAGTATPAGNGTYATSSSFTPSAIGTYWWYASSASDTNNNAVTSTCGAGMTSTVVGKASPTLSVTAPGTGTAGTTITAANITATLASSSGTNDVNTITFTVFGPQTTAPTTCTSGGTAAGTATPAGNGTYATSSSFTPSGAGTYWWYASSASDTNNNAVTSTCGSTMTKTVVAKASPTLSVTAPGTGTAGTTITAANITATLASSSGTNDTNTITFTVFGPQTTAPTTCTSGGTAAGTATPAGNGTYATSSSFTPSGAGTYWWYASSALDTNNNAVTSTCGAGMTSTVVAKASPTLSVTAPGTGTAGTTITAANITATLASSSGTNDVNTITFKVFGPQTTAPTTCTSGGTAAGTATPAGNGTYATSSSFTPSGAGTYWWYASSALDTNNNAVTSTCGAGMTSTVVAKASPTLSVTAPGTGTEGTAITAANITATLANSSGASDTNTITFTVFGPQTTAPTTCTSGGTAAGTATPAGNGTYATSSSFTPSAIGTYWWYASSASDTNNNAVTSTCGAGMTSTVVGKASPTLSVTAPGTGTAGTTITAANITATLASSSGTNDTNTITFTVFGPQTTAPTTCTSGGTAAGTATPAGNGTYATSSSFTPSGAGTYWWYASSASDTNNNAVTSTCGSTMTKTVVAKASPTLSVTAPGTGTAGTTITAANITATLASSSGTNDVNTITFKVFGPQTTAPTTCTSGGTAAGTATPAGNGTYATSSSFTPSGAGTYWWYASSALDTNNNAVTSTCGSTMTKTVVAKASPTLSVTAPGTGTASTTITAANITATLASSSGTNDVNTITFTVFGPQATAPTTCTSGGTAAGTATPAGNGTYATSSSFTPGVAGTYWWYASSALDTNNNAVTSTCGAGMTSTVVAAAPVPTLIEQANSPSTTSVTSLNVTLPNNLTTGDTLILSYASESDSGNAPTSVTYNGQSFVKEASNTAATGYGSSQVWALFNFTAVAGTKNITINLSGSTYVQLADVTEWTGLNGTVGPANNSSNSNTGTSVTAGSITTTGLDLVISTAYVGGGNGTLPTTPAGFTTLTLAEGGSPLNYRGYGAYEVQASPGAIQATWTQPNSAQWSAAVASFGP